MKAYSYHTFILPFIWENRDDNPHSKARSSKKYVFDVDDAVNGKKSICSHFEELEIDGKKMWSKIDYSTMKNSELLYKEQKYFYSHVRDSLYNEEIVKTYSLNMPDKKDDNNNQPIYTIKKGNLEYKLIVEDIEVKIYNTGIGLYAMKCYNNIPEQYNLDAVKNINDYGRRITLPFIGAEKIICTESMQLSISDNLKFVEDWSELNGTSKGKTNFNLEYISKTILGPMGFSNEESDIQLATDDRMFVLSWVTDEAKAELFVSSTEGERAYHINPNLSKDLYEVAAIDPADGCTCHSMEMRTELLDKFIYRRWLDEKSIYTFAPQGIVCVSSAADDGDFSYLIDNFNTQYYQMSCLCLAQLTSIVHFNKEAEHISHEIEQESKSMQTSKRNELLVLQERFVAFMAQVDASEASPEEQGMELYKLIRDALKIEREKDYFKEQMDCLYEIANASQDLSFNKWAAILSASAIILAVADLIGNNYSFKGISLIAGIAIIIAIIIGIVIYYYHKRTRR